MLTSPDEGSAGNRCRACPGEGSTGSRQQATHRGWRPARPRALVRAPGAQKRPVWPVESVCWCLAQEFGAGREFADIYPCFWFSAAEKWKKNRVLKGVLAISSLGFKGAPLGYSLVFVTSFFHLVITYHWISWSREEIGKRVEIRNCLISCNSCKSHCNQVWGSFDSGTEISLPQIRFINTELGKQFLLCSLLLSIVLALFDIIIAWISIVAVWLL